MLEKVKLALRISHTLLDNDIEDTIRTARAEMIRSGVAECKVEDETDDLITSAIKTYCLFSYANDTKMQEGYFKSFTYQIENLRKSSEYCAEVI